MSGEGKPDLGKEGEGTIYIGNLSYFTTEDDLKNLFKNCGEITRINLPKSEDTTINKGFSFLTFANSESIKEALLLNGKDIDGRKMIVTFGDRKVEPERKVKLNLSPKKYNSIFMGLISSNTRKLTKKKHQRKLDQKNTFKQ
jgi:RNA recognition motif-containing protein